MSEFKRGHGNNMWFGCFKCGNWIHLDEFVRSLTDETVSCPVCGDVWWKRTEDGMLEFCATERPERLV